MRATSDGQYVDFIVHVIINAYIDEPPYIVNPVQDVVFNEFPQTIQVNLNGVATDPDDPDDQITYSVISNSNSTALMAQVTNKILYLFRQNENQATAELLLRATSDGQYVDFNVHVIINAVIDEPPYIINPVQDVEFDDFPQTFEINLDGVATDPDDPDENIIYSIISNPFPEDVSATMNGKTLVLTREANNDADFSIVMRAISDGQYVDFEVHIVMYIIEGVNESHKVVQVYPNPTNGMITIDLVEKQGFEYTIYDLVGQSVLSGQSHDDSAQIDLSSCHQGIYFVVISWDGNRLIQKVIVR
jgi:putative lipoic acid-binding regulatory protein